MRFARPRLLFLCTLILIVAACRALDSSDADRPYVGLNIDEAGEAWISGTLDSLSLEDRVAQMFAVSAMGRFEPDDAAAWSNLVSAVRDLGVGGIVFFQGTPFEQVSLINDLQRQATVPLLISQDMEWGAGMRVSGASRYPVPMAIAASGDTALAYRTGLATALEARALGVNQILAPVADVNSNPRNPVIGTRAFSDHADVTAAYVSAFVRGVQEVGLMATVKHFPGHGGTSSDSHEVMPVMRANPERLDSLDLVPFRAAIDARVASIMTGHVAYPALEAGELVPASLSPTISTTLLRDSLHFDGLVVTDALNMSAVAGIGTPGDIAVRAIEAGADMLLMSTDVWAAHRDVVAAVQNGRISEERIAASVRRILRAKASTGLDRRRPLALDEIRQLVSNGEQRALEELVAERSLTLLRGSSPLVSDRPGHSVLLVVLSDRDQPDREAEFEERLRLTLPDATIDVRRIVPNTPTSVTDAVVRSAQRHQSVLIAAFVSAPVWWQRPGIAGMFRRVIQGLASSRRPTTLVAFGTPWVVSDLDPLPDGILLAWDNSQAMQIAAAEGVAGRIGLNGRLPIELAGSFEFGSGITADAVQPHDAVPESVGMDSWTVSLVDSVITAAIANHAFPGAALVVGRGDAIVHEAGYGYYTYESDRKVTPRSAFDMASVTKVVATTTAMMLLYDQGRISLDDPVARYVPEFGRNGKDSVTIRHLLTHTGGVIPFRAFYRLDITTRDALLESIFNEELQYEPGTESRYSDFGPIMLALVVERITGQPFDRFVTDSIFEPLGMWHTGFRSTGRPDPAVVPTERDDYFRHRLMQGEVHDETAWILGGTAGHAGLFSTADDLARFAAMMVGEGRLAGRAFLRPETVRLFTTRVDTTGAHTRALGWDTRSLDGPSSAGTLFGPRSFGHTGFTGTSIWIDPDAKLFVILLTNRVYPTRDNQRHVPVRPAVADVAFRAIRSTDLAPLLPSPLSLGTLLAAGISGPILGPHLTE